MDTDGVEAEVLYCEVSAFRYLYLMKDGWQRGDPRVQRRDARVRRASTRSASSSTSQIPIHDIDAAVRRGRSASRRSACKSLQLPVFPTELGLPDYFDERYDPLWARDPGDRAARSAATSASTPNLDDLIARDPTPQMGVMVPMTALSTGEALGMWMLTGVLERFPRAQGRVRRARPRLGRRGTSTSSTTWSTRQRLRVPGDHGAAELLLPPQRHLTFIEEPDAIQSLRHRLGVDNILWSTDYPHPVSSWPNSRAIVEQAVRPAFPTTSAS